MTNPTGTQELNKFHGMIALTPDKKTAIDSALARALTQWCEIAQGGVDEYFYVSSGTDAARVPYSVVIILDEETGIYYGSCECRYAMFQGEIPDGKGQPCKHIAACFRTYQLKQVEKAKAAASEIAPLVKASDLVKPAPAAPAAPAPAAPAVRYCGCGNEIDPDQDIKDEYCNDCLEAQMDAQLEAIEASQAAPRGRIEKKMCLACGHALSICREGLCYTCLVLAEREKLISKYGQVKVKFNNATSARKAG